MEKKYQVTHNIIYNFLGQFVLLAIGVVSTPFIIHHLGNDLYGVLSLITIVIGYFSILDLGLGASIIKFIADFQAKGEQENLEKLIGTALTLYIMVGLLGGLLITIFTHFFVPNFLHIPNFIIPVAMTAFYISSFGFFINMILTVYNSIPNGLQRMDITNSRNIFFEILSNLGTVLILVFGGGLVEIVVWNILVTILATAIFFLVIKKILPGITLRPGFDLILAKRMLKFGGFKFISNLSGQVVFQLDKILISFFNPIAAVTFYTIPSLLVQRVLGLIHNITDAVFPALAAASVLDEGDRSRHLYLRMTKVITFCSFGAMMLLILNADNLLFLWLGQDFVDQSSSVLKIMAVAYFFAAMSAAGVIAADSTGMPQIPAFFATISAIINLIAALILIPRFGIAGAAWALLINFLLQVPFFLYTVNKKVLKISSLKVLRESVVRPIISGFLAFGVAAYVSTFLSDRLSNLLVVSIIFSISYLLINFFIGTFDKYDKLLAIHLINKIKK